MTKEVSQLDQVLIDTIQKATKVSGEIYDGAKSVTTKSIDFAMQQAPDLIHQLLMYNFIVSLLSFVFSLSLLIGSCYFIFYSFKQYASKKWDETNSIFLIFMIFPIGLSFIAMVNSTTWLKIWIAPKIYLIEYAARLLR